MDWTLIKIIGYCYISLMCLIGTSVFVVLLLVTVNFFQQKPVEQQETVCVPVVRRQDVPDAFYKAFEE